MPDLENKYKSLLEQVHEYSDRKIKEHETSIAEINARLQLRVKNPTGTPDNYGARKILTNRDLEEVQYHQNLINQYKESKSKNFSDDYLKRETVSLKTNIDQIADNLGLLKAKNGRNHTIDTIEELNNKKLFKLKDIYKTPDVKRDYEDRVYLDDEIADYKKLLSIYNVEQQLGNMKKKVLASEQSKKSKEDLSNGFRNYKKRETAVFQSDEFGIYNFDAIRKELNPTIKTLESFQERASKRAQKDEIVLLQNISDRRTANATNKCDPIKFVHSINVPKTDTSKQLKLITHQEKEDELSLDGLDLSDSDSDDLTKEVSKKSKQIAKKLKES